MVNLQQLKEEIAAIGEKIKSLKSASEIDKDAVKAAVADLLAKKKLYADNNDGIGVDGNKYEELTKAQKKAKEKAEKGAEGPPKAVSSFRRCLFLSRLNFDCLSIHCCKENKLSHTHTCAPLAVAHNLSLALYP